MPRLAGEPGPDLGLRKAIDRDLLQPGRGSASDLHRRFRQPKRPGQDGLQRRVRLAVEPAAPGAQWVRLSGDEGAVELGWQSSSFISSLGERARIGQGCFDMDNYERLANAFADVAAKRVDPWLNDADLARTLDLVQAAHLSLGAGLAVEAPRRQRRIVAA